jgi:hypothetical protein
MPMILGEILLFQLNVFFNMIFTNSADPSVFRNIYAVRLCVALFIVLVQSGCEVDDPVKEEVPELITTVTLTFTPQSAGGPVVVSAVDPDGEGVQDIQIDDPIHLIRNTTYTLTISLINGLADPTQPEYDVGVEVKEEADEHMIFFSWTNNLFNSPVGDGNVDNPADLVNYLDEDENELPLGMVTSWTTSAPTSGELRIILKHQPDLKSPQSDSHTGETDLDITFPVEVQ